MAVIVSENPDLSIFNVDKYLFIIAGILSTTGFLYGGEWSLIIYLKYNFILTVVYLVREGTFSWKSSIMSLAFLLLAPALTMLFLLDNYMLAIILPDKTKTPI